MAKNARVYRVIARVKKNENLQRLKLAAASRGDAALELLRRMQLRERELLRRLQRWRDHRGDEHELRLDAVRVMEDELLPELWDADDRTGVTLARLILSSPLPIRASQMLMLRDRLTGELPDSRWSCIEAERPSAYVCTVIESYSRGYGGGFMQHPDALAPPLVPQAFVV